MKSDIILIAEKEVGYTETPPHSNKTKYGKWFGFDGVAWCGIFCSWVYDKAGHPIKKGGFTKGFAGVPTLVTNHGNKKVIDPEPGDLVIFDWNGDGRVDHVGIFRGWIDQGQTFMTIEGNTSLNNQSNGGQVMKRSRNMTFVNCFIRLI